MTKLEQEWLENINAAVDVLGFYCLPAKTAFRIYNKANEQVQEVASVDRTDGRSTTEHLNSVAQFFSAAVLAMAAPASTQAPLRGHDERIIRNHPDQPGA
jgi:hypothetical protein